MNRKEIPPAQGEEKFQNVPLPNDDQGESLAAQQYFRAQVRNDSLLVSV
jgi:hypothetical protein